MATLIKKLDTVDSVEACECMCSECGALTTFTAFDFDNVGFCPQCGAKIGHRMVEDDTIMLVEDDEAGEE